MFISALELFKVGIGPSSSHTMGPMVAANQFLDRIEAWLDEAHAYAAPLQIRCYLKGSLAHTGKGHATDRAVALGLHGYMPQSLADEDIDALMAGISDHTHVWLTNEVSANFNMLDDIVFDRDHTPDVHPNGLSFEFTDGNGGVLIEETYFSIGGGFVCTTDEIAQIAAPLKMMVSNCPYAFDSAAAMVQMSEQSGLSIPEMKRVNECTFISEAELDEGLDLIWHSMERCVRQGLAAEGVLPGGLGIKRRAAELYGQLKGLPGVSNLNDWLCAYAMAVNEENAAGHMVVTAPTNGAAGVVPAVLYYFVHNEGGQQQQIRDFLLTAAAIGGIIKHRSSISGAEVGCQGEVGSAAAMAAAGLCAARGGSAKQVEHAAEMALEHHLGMTCDPVNGLVQVPCIERNGFGAIKAYTATSLALRGSGQHFMPLDNCIAAMKQTGLEMSAKYKETSLGGLAVSLTEC